MKISLKWSSSRETSLNGTPTFRIFYSSKNFLSPKLFAPTIWHDYRVLLFLKPRSKIYASSKKWKFIPPRSIWSIILEKWMKSAIVWITFPWVLLSTFSDDKCAPGTLTELKLKFKDFRQLIFDRELKRCYIWFPFKPVADTSKKFKNGRSLITETKGGMHSCPKFIYEMHKVFNFLKFMIDCSIEKKTREKSSFWLIITGFLIMSFFKLKLNSLLMKLSAKLWTAMYPIWFCKIDSELNPPYS